ncbi:hypothetical protein IAR50_005124 [Cryptococcus sp. DSM 104548]
MTSRKRLFQSEPASPSSSRLMNSPSSSQGQRVTKRRRAYMPSARSSVPLHAVTPSSAASVSPSPLRQSLISENNIRTTCGPSGSLPLPLPSTAATRLSFSYLDSSSPTSYITDSSLNDDIRQSTPRRARRGLSVSSNGRPSVYERANGGKEDDMADEIVLGVTPYPSPQRDITRKPLPARNLRHLLSDLGGLQIQDSPPKFSGSLSRSSSARTRMTVQTPPSGGSKRSLAIFQRDTGDSSPNYSSSPPGAPPRKRRNMATAFYHGSSPISRRQRKSVTPEQPVPPRQSTSESDSEPEVDVIMEDPRIMGLSEMWARKGDEKKIVWKKAESLT